VKLARLVVIALALAPLALLRAQDAGKDAPKPDAVDTESIEAKTLAGKLHVPPNWRPASSSVDLSYFFSEEPQLLDWKWTGADKTALSGGLEVGCGSDACAIGLLEGLEWNGDLEVEATVKFAFMGVTTDFALLVGVKGSEAVGARWGDQYVKVKKGRISAVTKNEPSKDKFALQKVVEIRLVRKGDELRTWINKVERPSHKFSKKELDGRIGFLFANNARVNVTRFTAKGAIDKSKL
jgi:hypothetical protein